jgi:hypothetical protein
MSEDSITYNFRIKNFAYQISEAMSLDDLDSALKNANNMIKEIVKYKKYIKQQKQLKRKRIK